MDTINTPKLSRIDFFRCSEGELITFLAQAIENETTRSAEQEAIVAWSSMSYNVLNGGFVQYFYNNRGDRGVPELAKQLEEFDLPKAATIVREAQTVYLKHQDKFTTANPWDGLFGSIDEFEKLDTAFMKFSLRGTRAFEKWIRSKIATLAQDGNGNPIDPDYSGMIEERQSDGILRQSLEVKKGKPHGKYCSFFENGSPRESLFYKSGKQSGEFWPDGTFKRREFKRGNLTIIEWYHPNGQVWKRYVKLKSGYTAEPIRLYYSNGQLAEELTVIEGVKNGPWLKYFEDGSPKLKAEYTAEEKLIVHDAWNDDHVQVVKDGTGVFRDYDHHIDWEYDVLFENNWQREAELKGGIPHGKVTMYSYGKLWRASNFVDGIEDGESNSYWDNGHVKYVRKNSKGIETDTKIFPKYDKPIPVVVLKLQADEKLYKAWQHLVLDDYPRALNFDEIRKLLVVPEFHREVYERNLTGNIKDEYEDWFTFDDGIAYFLTVNESGEVTEAVANGSGVYSGGCWDTYPPILRQLKFTPGRIRERAVACRVLARVDHTFEEGS